MNVVDRAKNILLVPKPEWVLINNEKSTVATVLTSYVLPMLAIGFVATFIGQGLIGKDLGPYLGRSASVKAGLIGALVYVVLSVINVFVLAGIIEVLAPSFTSEKNWEKSFQLAAYSLTAAYVGAIFLLFPALNILVIICSVYSIYALYVGIPIIKKTPEDKQVGYLAVIILLTIVAMILISLIQAEIMKSFYRPSLPRMRF
jgi:hypothetical protein